MIAFSIGPSMRLSLAKHIRIVEKYRKIFLYSLLLLLFLLLIEIRITQSIDIGILEMYLYKKASIYLCCFIFTPLL